MAEETSNSQLFEDIWQKTVTKIDGIAQDETARKFLLSLVMGGTVAAESVISSCEEIKRLWGQGSDRMANEFSQLFSLMMLSQIYRWVREQPPKEMTNTVPPEISATRIVYLFDGNPEQGMDDFAHFDKQYEYDLKHHPHLIHFSSLLLAKCAEICDHKTIDWSKVKWPVVEMTHLVKGAIIDGAPIRAKLDIDNMLNSLNTGVQAMMSFYGGA